MSETLLKTRVFDVQRRTFSREGGEPLQRDVVIHPGAAVILPLLDRERIVMIRNVRHSVGEELLELPAGTLEPGEDPIETAARELEEETGYAAGQLEAFLSFYTSPGICTERMHAFIASELTPTQVNPEEGESIRVELMHRTRLREAIYNGEIRDGKTIAVLAALLLKEGA